MAKWTLLRCLAPRLWVACLLILSAAASAAAAPPTTAATPAIGTRGEEYCKTVDARPQPNLPNYINAGNCIIQRIDNLSNSRLCRLGLMGDQLPPVDPATGKTPNAGSLPHCVKFCYFEDSYIRSNPPPWPVDSASGVRPSWKNQQRVECPRDPATGNWALSAAPTFPKRVECRWGESRNNPGKCLRACKVFETRSGLVAGRNYRAAGESVQTNAGWMNLSLDAKGDVVVNPNPLVNCPSSQ